MKHGRIVYLGITGLLIIALSGCSTWRWRQPEAQIKLRMLRETPLGSTDAEVKNFIVREGWKLEYEWQATNSWAATGEYPYVEGVHVVGGYLGGYQGMPWHVDVQAFWGFDEEGKLIDLHVRKCADAL